MTRPTTEPEREWYRRLCIALWSPRVDRPMAYLARKHRRTARNWVTVVMGG